MEKSGTRCRFAQMHLLLESKVQVPLTAAYEDVAADDEHSDTDDEDQHVSTGRFGNSFMTSRVTLE
jgi:hypothetical protein